MQSLALACGVPGSRSQRHEGSEVYGADRDGHRLRLSALRAPINEATGEIADELIEAVTVGPDWFSVTVSGSPAVRIRYGEVGPKDSDPVGVGGGVAALNPRHHGDWVALSAAA